jgi:hypothetical protein
MWRTHSCVPRSHSCERHASALVLTPVKVTFAHVAYKEYIKSTRQDEPRRQSVNRRLDSFEIASNSDSVFHVLYIVRGLLEQLPEKRKTYEGQYERSSTR